MIKVLHIVESYGGGVQTYFDGIINESRKVAGVTHDIAYSFRAETNLEQLKNTAKYSNLIELPTLYNNFSFRKVIDWCSDVRKLIDTNHYDVIHVHSSIAGGLVRLFLPFYSTKKCLFTPHGYSFLRKDISYLKRAIFYLLEKTLTTVSKSTVIACSESEGLYASKITRKVKVVNNAIDTSAIKKYVTAKSNSVGPIKVGIVGRVTIARNPSLFIQISKIINNCQPNKFEFVWVGGGSQDDVEKLKRAGIRVTGWLARTEALQQMNTLDIYMQTSLWEGMPLSVLESQAMGIPVVASNIIGNKDIIVHKKTGYLCEDYNEFVNALIQLQDPLKREQFGEDARERIENNFSLPVQYNNLIKIYREVTSI